MEEQGCIQLAHELTACHCLRYIDLTGNSLSPEGAGLIRSILPPYIELPQELLVGSSDILSPSQ